jgi:hypothetical protein
LTARRRLHRKSATSEAPTASQIASAPAAIPARIPAANDAAQNASRILGFRPSCEKVVSVGARGFEPPTFRSRTERATRLRHAPIFFQPAQKARLSPLSPAPSRRRKLSRTDDVATKKSVPNATIVWILIAGSRDAALVLVVLGHRNAVLTVQPRAKVDGATAGRAERPQGR